MMSFFNRLISRRALRISIAWVSVAALLAVTFPALGYGAVLSIDTVRLAPYQKSHISKDVMPDVSMKAGLLADNNGSILWSRSLDERRAMASITKIMTAIVALDNSKPEDIVTIPHMSVTVGESSAGLREGQQISMSDLIKALMVKSGNDAAIAIATHVSGSTDAFVKQMNAKAKELGMTGTHFTNPHGLDQAGHYTTARDIAIMARYAMKFESFNSVVSQKKVTIGTGKYRHTVENTNLLLIQYPGANGIKTGWTDNAGYCVVGSAQRNGLTLYAVVLGTQYELTRFGDAKRLLDFGFAHYRSQKLLSTDTVVGKAVVADYLDVSVSAVAEKECVAYVLDLEGDIKREITLDEVKAPVAKGDKIGRVLFKQNKRIIVSMPLVATESVAKPSWPERVWIALVRLWQKVF